MLSLPKAYETEFLAEKLEIIEIRPTYDTDRREREEESESSEADRIKVESFSDQWFTKFSGKSFD